ncbi:cytochrome P450 [Mycena olivaceomarginata]|nr:cytochrome P450 [Mycena olivaceomarginata]
MVLFDAGSSLAYFILAFVVLFYGFALKRNRSKLPLPPGPKKLPIVGNLFDIPRERQWETYMAWSREYNSDIIQLSALGTSIVVLSSIQAAKELLDKRSSLYSDRVRCPMVVELMGWDFAIGTFSFRRQHRRLFHEEFNIDAQRQYHPQERAAIHALLWGLLRDSGDVKEHFRHMTAALVMNVTYGINVLPSNDPYIRLAEDAMHAISIAGVPGAFLVDTIPVLKYVPSWVPGAGFQRKARAWKKITRDMYEAPFAEAKRRMGMGDATPSFTSRSLRTVDESNKDVNVKATLEEVVKATAANVYSAGSDTTASVLETFVLGMLANPEAQKRAQAEIDSVVGHGNLPDFVDQPALPYVSAIVKETLRWKNVTPIAIPHYIAVEDEYQGYRIPADSIVIANVWAMLHDKTAFPDPDLFNPERFLLDGKLNPAIRDPEAIAFGFGRRICPGRHMASASLWLTIASMLATLDISKAIDEQGNVIEPTYEYFEGLVSAPLPFKCSITPRSPQTVEAIQATVRQ